VQAVVVPRERSSSRTRARTLLIGLTAVTLAWGVFAFGAVYPWSYLPLLAGVSLAGCLGIALGRETLPRGLVFALVAVAVAIVIQLVPLPAQVLRTVTPATDRLLQTYDLQYRIPSSGGAAHALSIDPVGTARALMFCVGLSVFLIGLAAALRGRDARRLTVCLTVIGTLVALAAIVQRANYNGLVYGFWTPIEGRADSFGPFVNKDHFAGWMLMTIPVCMGLLCGLAARAAQRVRNDWRSRFLWLSSAEASGTVLVGFAIVVMTLSLMLALSRSGIMCFLFGVAAIGVMQWRHSSSGRSVIAYLALATTIAFVWAGSEPITTRFRTGSVFDLAGRVPLWSDAVQVIAAFPLTGTGLNTYSTAMLFFQTTNREFRVRAAHNDYLQIAADGGLLLVIPAAIAVLAFVFAVRRQLASDNPESVEYWIRVGAVVGMLSMALQSCVDFSLQIPGNAALFCVLGAIALHPTAGAIQNLTRRA
jgi:O-antigen ligase